jgi:hypothetical protein
VKIPKHSIALLIKQKYPCENTKIPLKAKFFFSKVKNILLLFMESEKTRNTLVQHLNIFLILGQRNIFVVTKLVKNQENSWLIILNFINSRSKRIFLQDIYILKQFFNNHLAKEKDKKKTLSSNAYM